ncbi:hypothetical protein DV20_41075 [Amycolatopsis rifamycinica]|uniref:Uncharacterized protein n=1 Tax=Amycolatopsis rifamycinica TaxID=287986 RepID=A0A066TWY5_9PSEU|nr:hypothetical protein DV20_41075 [Amycolatopsis rifamycinica]
MSAPQYVKVDGQNGSNDTHEAVALQSALDSTIHPQKFLPLFTQGRRKFRWPIWIAASDNYGKAFSTMGGNKMSDLKIYIR